MTKRSLTIFFIALGIINLLQGVEVIAMDYKEEAEQHRVALQAKPEEMALTQKRRFEDALNEYQVIVSPLIKSHSFVIAPKDSCFTWRSYQQCVFCDDREDNIKSRGEKYCHKVDISEKVKGRMTILENLLLPLASDSLPDGTTLRQQYIKQWPKYHDFLLEAARKQYAVFIGKEDRRAAEVAAKKKAEEEAIAKKKLDDDAAAAKAEADRKAAEAAAKKKEEEEAAKLLDAAQAKANAAAQAARLLAALVAAEEAGKARAAAEAEAKLKAEAAAIVAKAEAAIKKKAEDEAIEREAQAEARRKAEEEAKAAEVKAPKLRADAVVAAQAQQSGSVTNYSCCNGCCDNCDCNKWFDNCKPNCTFGGCTLM